MTTQAMLNVDNAVISSVTMLFWQSDSMLAQIRMQLT